MKDDSLHQNSQIQSAFTKRLWEMSEVCEGLQGLAGVAVRVWTCRICTAGCEGL